MEKETEEMVAVAMGLAAKGAVATGAAKVVLEVVGRKAHCLRQTSCCAPRRCRYQCRRP